jgi:hypothetical protein
MPNSLRSGWAASTADVNHFEEDLFTSPVPHVVQGSVPALGGTAEMRLLADAVGEGTELGSVAAVLHVFATAIDRGLFGPAARLAVGTVNVAGPHALWIAMRVSDVPPGAFRVLVELLEAWQEGAVSEPSLQLRTVSSNTELVDVRQLRSLSYPIAAGHDDFEVRRLRDEENAKEPVIRLRFLRALTESEYEVVASTVEAWSELLLQGGFSTPVSRERSSPALRQTYMAAPATAEHVFYSQIGAPEAFDAVVNGARYLHARVCPLMALEVE